VKKCILALAVLIASQSVSAAYSDRMLESNEGLSPFDRAYEAGQAQKMSEPVDYRESKVASGALLDLSVDDPVISVKETETERRFRNTLVELEQSRKNLELERKKAMAQMESTQASVTKSAELRAQSLVAQQSRIEEQRKHIEEQRAAIRAQEQAVQQALEKNKSALAEADQLKHQQLVDLKKVKAESDHVLMMAENSAVVIETAAKARVTLERVDPTVVLNEQVKVEYQGATLKEIVTGIMPLGWRVKTDFSVKPELETRRYEFISTESRDIALRGLTKTIRDAKVRFAYFWDLQDENGNPAPMILLTDRPNN
jgi:multidrug efflux pump subunit AcrA (membrane-fusion protein)